jgi:chromosome segregation ATPase
LRKLRPDSEEVYQQVKVIRQTRLNEGRNKEDEKLLDAKEQNGEELEPSQDRTAELEGLIAQKDQELASKNTHISELEQTVASLNSEITALKQAIAETSDKLNGLNESFSQAVASYKTLVIKSNPEVLEELVTGETIETIDESLASAKALISRVRQGIEAEISSARVPAGAPERTPPDLSALTPREKIQHAIGSFSS